jgi:hypothetical protein
MKSLVVDFHSGCIQAIVDAVAPNESNLEILSFSGHNHLIKELLDKHRVSRLDRLLVIYFVFGIRGIVFRRFRVIRNAIKKRKAIPWMFGIRYQNIWISFPPAMYQNLLKSQLSQTVSVLVSHRMDLWIDSKIVRNGFWEQMQRDIEKSNLRIVAASAYDSEYVKYYSGIDVPILTPHLSYISNLLNRSKPPLIGPSNIDADSLLVQEIQKQTGFATIRQFYENYSYDDLSRHSTFILLPYSVYSISLLEIAMTGAPILVPSDRFILESEILHDVKLYPHYSSQLENEDHLQDSKLNLSPNCYCNDCSLHWLKFANWKEFPNVFYWDNIEEINSLIPFAIANSVDITDYRNEIRRKFNNFMDCLIRGNQGK